MNADSITTLSPATGFALIYLFNLWLSFALPLRWLWLATVAWAGGLLYLWIAHQEAVTSLLTVLTLLPIAGLIYGGYAASFAVFGLVSGQILRRVRLNLSIKCAGALVASVVLLQVSSMLGEQSVASRKEESDAFHAQRLAVHAFYERTTAAGKELVAIDPRVALITGESPTVDGGDPERRRNRAGLPAVGYIFHAEGAKGEAWAKVRITGSVSAPELSVERVGRSWKEAATGRQ
jgi:hypothetical protein